MGNFALNITPYVGSILREFDGPDEKNAAKIFAEKTVESNYPFNDRIYQLIDFIYFNGKEVKDPSHFLSLILNPSFVNITLDNSPGFNFLSNSNYIKIFIEILNGIANKKYVTDLHRIKRNLVDLNYLREKENYSKVFFSIGKNGGINIRFGLTVFLIPIFWSEFTKKHDWINKLCLYSILMYRYNEAMQKNKKQPSIFQNLYYCEQM